MFSYTLSVRALIRSRQSSSDGTTDAPSQSAFDRALVISMPETPNQTPLPFAAEEAAVVKSLCDLMNLTMRSISFTLRLKRIPILRAGFWRYTMHGESTTARFTLLWTVYTSMRRQP